MNLNFKLNDTKDGLIVTRSKEKLAGELIIPSEYFFEGRTYPVTEIGTSAFSQTNLTSVVIPDSVVKIGRNAFGLCRNLFAVVFSNSLKEIDNYAFGGCWSLSSIIIPKSVDYFYSFFCQKTKRKIRVQI